VYNRCFDEQNQLRIRLECTAIEGVYALAEAGLRIPLNSASDSEANRPLLWSKAARESERISD
jgi:hypothetical protein